MKTHLLLAMLYLGSFSFAVPATSEEMLPYQTLLANFAEAEPASIDALVQHGRIEGLCYHDDATLQQRSYGVLRTYIVDSGPDLPGFREFELSSMRAGFTYTGTFQQWDEVREGLRFTHPAQSYWYGSWLLKQSGPNKFYAKSEQLSANGGMVINVMCYFWKK